MLFHGIITFQFAAERIQTALHCLIFSTISFGKYLFRPIQFTLTPSNRRVSLEHNQLGATKKKRFVHFWLSHHETSANKIVNRRQFDQFRNEIRLNYVHWIPSVESQSADGRRGHRNSYIRCNDLFWKNLLVNFNCRNHRDAGIIVIIYFFLFFFLSFLKLLLRLFFHLLLPLLLRLLLLLLPVFPFFFS